jgi:hypothetical protein
MPTIDICTYIHYLTPEIFLLAKRKIYVVLSLASTETFQQQASAKFKNRDLLFCL